MVENGIAYLDHMQSPHGTTLVDVRDPKNPKELAHIAMPPGTHSHKVRVAGDIMVVNHEINGNDKNPVPADFKPGYDGGNSNYRAAAPSPTTTNGAQ